ncbi:DUF6876 family protein [Subsaximicrobium wynnwilliamsii]|uniref:DUF6876 family protein n=1 Tax=Subsaximicrobium wynnwilliamsii TaxID=291179 RepID=UPI0037442EDE
MFYQIPLLRTRFTDGLKYLSEVAKCFWLITDTSVTAKSLMNRSSFVSIDFIRLSEKSSYIQVMKLKLFILMVIIQF